MKLVFRIIVFALLTAFFLVLLGGGSQGLGLPPELGFAQWGPGIAGLLMLLIFRKDGFHITWFDRETPAVHYVLALLVPLSISVIILFGLAAVVPDFTLSSIAAGVGPLAFLWMPFGALGEEIGWRGYLQKRLNDGMPGLWAALLTGALWTFIHLHFYANGVLFLIVLMLAFMGMSIVIQALSAEYGFNVLIAALLHVGVNIGSALVFSAVNNIAFALFSAVLWGAAAAFAVLRRRGVFLP